jgi:hypothetical protein
MTLAVSLWRLFQSDRLVRWAVYVSIVVVWFALAWADVRILVALAPVALLCLWLRRQRERRGWLTEPEIDVDLL